MNRYASILLLLLLGNCIEDNPSTLRRIESVGEKFSSLFISHFPCASRVERTSDAGYIWSMANHTTKIDKDGNVIESYDHRAGQPGSGWFAYDLVTTGSGRLFIVEGITQWGAPGYVGSNVHLTELDPISGLEIGYKAIPINVRKPGSPTTLGYPNGFYGTFIHPTINANDPEKILIPLSDANCDCLAEVDVDASSLKVVQDFTEEGAEPTDFTFNDDGNFVVCYRAATPTYYYVRTKIITPNGVLIFQSDASDIMTDGLRQLHSTSQGMLGLHYIGIIQNDLSGPTSPWTMVVYGGYHEIIEYELFKDELVLIRQTKSTVDNVCVEWYNINTMEKTGNKCFTITAEELLNGKGIYKDSDKFYSIYVCDDFTNTGYFIRLEKEE